MKRNFEAFKDCVSVSPITQVCPGNLQGGDLANAATSAALDSYLTDAALVIAATNGFDSIARLVLEMGARISLTHGAGKWTALHLAAKHGHSRVVQTLLQYCANVNALTAEGCTPLYYAAVSGQHDILNVLVEHGTCIESWHFYGRMTFLPHRAEQSAFQKYMIESAISEACSDCGEMRANYTVCP